MRVRRRRPGLFVVVKPETAGVALPGGEPPTFQFDIWLGDELVRAHPHFLVTAALRSSLRKLRRHRGYSFDDAAVRPSTFFRRHSPDRRLPHFWQLLVDGRPGVDDMGISDDGSLVVSLRVMETMLRSRVRRASFCQYAPGAQPATT